MQPDSPLLTDQYQLIMAYSYWKLGMAEQEAVFQLSFRKLPKNANYIVAAGLQRVIDFLSNYKFSSSDLAYLKQLQKDQGLVLSNRFLSYLKKLTFTCDVDAVLEGTLIFAQEPILRIKGPLLQCQLLESPLLNLINFASLIATKASKVFLAADADPIIEFGLRRAQGPDGALTASRSAYIGGCSGTSNILAGKLFGIPLHGTQAHSWIMAFPTEREAFEKFAEIMKDNTILLVDTYNTIQGIGHAIEVGHQMVSKGQRLSAIRLDSGNLLELSSIARNLLDQAGLNYTKIIASGDLDEDIISNLKASNAPIDAWGVGTKLVTAFDQPALNAIYKLTALKTDQNQWAYKMKLSDDLQKTTLPGLLQVKRFYQNQIPIKDIIYDIELDESDFLNTEEASQDLLKPIFRRGKAIYSSPSLPSIRENCLRNLKIFVNDVPKPYPVVLGDRMQQKREELMQLLKAKQ